MGKRKGLRARLRRAAKHPGEGLSGEWTVLTFGEPHEDCEVCRVLGVAGAAERTGRSPEHRTPGGSGFGGLGSPEGS